MKLIDNLATCCPGDVTVAPGPAFAFRSMFDTVDGPDYERERRAFDQWRHRFPDTPPRPCQDDP